MSRTLPSPPPGGTESEKPTPASSHVDEAVAHSHDHAHLPGGGQGGHSHDHSHATASTTRLGWALAVTGTVIAAELLGAFWSGSLSLAADAGHMVVDASGLVTGTPRRADLAAVQTPQGLRWDVLTRAHEAGASLGADEAVAATDDAGLVEAIGAAVHTVAGDERSLKVTRPLDLALARLLADQEQAD